MFIDTIVAYIISGGAGIYIQHNTPRSRSRPSQYATLHDNRGDSFPKLNPKLKSMLEKHIALALALEAFLD